MEIGITRGFNRIFVHAAYVVNRWVLFKNDPSPAKTKSWGSSFYKALEAIQILIASTRVGAIRTEHCHAT